LKEEKRVIMLLAKPYSVATRMRSQAETLAGAGYKVTVLAWDRWKREPEEADINGVHVRSVRLLGGQDLFVSSSGSKVSKFDYALSAILLQLYSFVWCLRNVRGSFTVHSNFPVLASGVALKLARPGQVKLVYDCNELTPSVYAEWYGPAVGLLAASLERLFLRFVDVAITVSEPILNYLARVGKPLSISDSSLILLYNSPRIADLPLGDKLSCRNYLGLTGFTVSFIGSMRGAYALEALIEAVRLFKDSSETAHFVIAGGGADTSALLKKKISEYGLEEYVTLMPQVEHELALEYVKSSDVTFAVFKDLVDNSRLAMPWKVLESMACGTPVLVRENTEAWNFVRKEGTGFAVGSIDPSEIYERLLWAKQHPSQLAVMSTTATRAFSKYDWEAGSKRLREIYDTL